MSYGKKHANWPAWPSLQNGSRCIERLALHTARVAGQENQRELTALADTLALEVDGLTAQVENLQAERAAAEKRAQEAEAGLKAMQEMFQQLGLKPTKSEVKKGQTTSEA